MTSAVWRVCLTALGESPAAHEAVSASPREIREPGAWNRPRERGSMHWNFPKYLIEREGRVLARYAPGVPPQQQSLVGEIECLLSKPRPIEPAAGQTN